MAMYTEEFISHFDLTGAVRYNDESIRVFNPLGDGKEPSCHISPSPENRKTNIYLFNDPSTDDKVRMDNVKAALEMRGLTMNDLYYPGTGKGGKKVLNWKERIERYWDKKYPEKRRRIEASYSYRNIETKEEVFTRIRYSTKEKAKNFDYGMISPDGSFLKIGLWDNESGKKLKRRDLPPAVYGSIDRILSRKENVIFFTEGEKDTETLQHFGYAAFTIGSSQDAKECKRVAPIVSGNNLIIFADNDASGYGLAVEMFQACQGSAETLKIILPVKDKDNGDISDFMKYHTAAELKDLIEKADDTEEVFCRKEQGAAAVSRDNENVTESVPASTSPSLWDKLKKDDKDRVMDAISNYCYILENDPGLKGIIRYNELTHSVYVCGDLPWKKKDESNFRAWNNTDESHLIDRVEQYGLRSDKRVGHAIRIVADTHSFNPLKDLLNSLEWDGVPRVKTLLSDYLGANEDWYSEEVMKLIMMGAINRVMHPGCKFDYTTILIGDQGKFKSTFVQVLAMDDEWYSESPNNFDTDEAKKVVRGKWIVELGELSAIRKTSDQEAVKKFLTTRIDRIRDAYDKYPEDNPRTCIFIGTTNSRSFLTDKTGNRRFIPITVNIRKPKKDLFDESVTEDIRQAWAEAMEIYRSGNYSLVPTGEFLDMIEQNRESAMEEDPLHAKIELYLENKTRVAATEIVTEIISPDAKDALKWSRTVNEIMSNMPGWKREAKRQRNPKYGLCQHYYREQTDPGAEFQSAEPGMENVFTE